MLVNIMRLTDSSKTGRTCALMKKCALIRKVRLTTRVYVIELSMYMHLLIFVLQLSRLMQIREETVLHAACRRGHVDVASLLLQHGAVVDTQDEVRLLYRSMVNMVCHTMVCSV